MADIIKLVPSRKGLPKDTAEIFGQIADAIDKGRITEIVACAIQDGEYILIKPSSMTESLILANLLHDSCVRDFIK